MVFVSGRHAVTLKSKFQRRNLHSCSAASLSRIQHGLCNHHDHNRFRFLTSAAQPWRPFFRQSTSLADEFHPWEHPRSFHSTAFTSSGTKNKISGSKPKRFEDVSLHPLTLKALRRHGLHRLTDVQEKTFDPIIDGQNVVARSRTGTGKTLAFLIPSLERILRSRKQLKLQQEEDSSGPPGIQMLIIAPTRELAFQIHKEAEKLLLFHQRSGKHHQKEVVPLTSQVIYGGSSKEQDIRQFQKQLPTILVATPGRLKDHLSSTTLKYTEIQPGLDASTTTTINVPFRKTLQSLQTLVLDETDRLLEMGFRRDIRDILSVIPVGDNISSSSQQQQRQQQRQTLLFSATLPQGVLDVVDLAMPTTSNNLADNTHDDDDSDARNYKLIDCIQEQDPATHTNEKTKQSYVVLPPQRFWTGSMEFILNLLEGSSQTAKRSSNNNVKVMVFFPMTRLAQLYYQFFALRLGQNQVWELHGKMHQRERTVVARRFRNASQGLLFTSDVSARGLDYPDVTHVVQIGAPPSRETYIHRLGRTGRAGKRGEGMLILPEMEEDFLLDLDGLHILPDEKVKHKLSRANITNRRLQNELGILKHDIQLGQTDESLEKSVKVAYHAMISYYFQTCSDKHQSVESVVSTVNQLVGDFGLRELPAIESSRASSMRIESLPGLNIRKRWDEKNWNDGSGWGNTSSGDETHDDQFQRKPYGEFDDWFGVGRAQPKPSKRLGESVPRRKDDFARVFKTQSKKRKEKLREERMKRFQRFDAPGVSLEKS